MGAPCLAGFAKHGLAKHGGETWAGRNTGLPEMGLPDTGWRDMGGARRDFPVPVSCPAELGPNLSTELRNSLASPRANDSAKRPFNSSLFSRPEASPLIEVIAARTPPAPQSESSFVRPVPASPDRHLPVTRLPRSRPSREKAGLWHRGRHGDTAPRAPQLRRREDIAPITLPRRPWKVQTYVRLHRRHRVAGNGRLFPNRFVDSSDILSTIRVVLLCNGTEKIATAT
jgi:hypothetical protein